MPLQTGRQGQADGPVGRRIRGGSGEDATGGDRGDPDTARVPPAPHGVVPVVAKGGRVETPDGEASSRERTGTALRVVDDGVFTC